MWNCYTKQVIVLLRYNWLNIYESTSIVGFPGTSKYLTSAALCKEYKLVMLDKLESEEQMSPTYLD